MKMPRSRLVAAALAGFASFPLDAQPNPGWEGPMDRPASHLGDPYYEAPYWAPGPRQGKVQVATFLATSPNITGLGHGPIVIAPPKESLGGDLGDAPYEETLADQLVKAGYEPGAGTGTGGQIAEFVISHDVIQPPEPPHSPVSGGVAVGGGNRGSGLGIALAVDLRKPLGALVSSRLEVRIRDKVTHELLWQGRAEVLSREGDKHWKNADLAAKLTAALFKGFPRPQAN